MMSVILWLQHYSVVVITIVFLLLIVTTYWPSRRAEMEHDAHIPLDDE